MDQIERPSDGGEFLRTVQVLKKSVPREGMARDRARN